MNRLKPWLLLILIFVAGFAGGVVVTRVAVRRAVKQTLNNPNLLLDKIERRMAGRLKLDQEQRAKTHEILLQSHEELKALRVEFQPRFLTILEHTRSEVSAVLTPAQREKFDRLVEENRPLWQPR